MNTQLQDVVRKYTRKGWKIVSQAETSVQLSKKRRPNTIVAIVLLILGILPGLIYIFWPRREKIVYLTYTLGKVNKR